MENHNVAVPEVSGLTPIITSLERHLAELDQRGAHIAAAYLDHAIQHLRLEQTRR